LQVKNDFFIKKKIYVSFLPKTGYNIQIAMSSAGLTETNLSCACTKADLFLASRVGRMP
jgi:hypothetical protein